MYEKTKTNIDTSINFVIKRKKKKIIKMSQQEGIAYSFFFCSNKLTRPACLM